MTQLTDWFAAGWFEVKQTAQLWLTGIEKTTRLIKSFSGAFCSPLQREAWSGWFCRKQLLAYRQDVRMAASGVWWFGIQSERFEAGTVGLESLQSVWGSRFCCTADTRSSVRGSPGHRWTTCGVEGPESGVNDTPCYSSELN